MREISVQENEAGQRLDKYLRKFFPAAPDGFLYKMLRKKNILVNGQKAEGGRLLQAGDTICLYLSEETIEKFRQDPDSSSVSSVVAAAMAAPDLSDAVIYENAHILVLNKPVGLLSQKAAKDDVSVVESVTRYLLESHQLTAEDLRTFHPAVCNRLDRNTSGLIIAGKTLKGLQAMSKLLRRRTIGKYYLCLTAGKISEPMQISGMLRKDPDTNRVTVIPDRSDTADSPSSDGGSLDHPKGSLIETAYTPLAWNEDLTLLFVHLLTGKPHQIRAHLALEGHPLIGDYKYGIREINETYRQRYGIGSQLLHAYELRFPDMNEPLEDLSGKVLKAAVPAPFYTVIKETLWEHGTREALEVLH